MTEFIAVYGEVSAMAGRICHDVEVTEDGRALGDDGREEGDVRTYEVTDEMASILERQAKTAGAGHDLYLLRVAREIRERL